MGFKKNKKQTNKSPDLRPMFLLICFVYLEGQGDWYKAQIFTCGNILLHVLFLFQILHIYRACLCNCWTLARCTMSQLLPSKHGKGQIRKIHVNVGNMEMLKTGKQMHISAMSFTNIMLNGGSLRHCEMSHVLTLFHVASIVNYKNRSFKNSRESFFWEVELK